MNITLDKGVNPTCLVLIKTGNEAQTHDGRMMQVNHAAYIDIRDRKRRTEPLHHPPVANR